MHVLNLPTGVISMSGFQVFDLRGWVAANCWSLEHLCFVIRREAILAIAQRVLGTRPDAERWFTHRVRSLDYQTPCSLLSTQSGYQRVHDVLMQIEYGVYI